jgi:two-component system, LytTR family, response regulator
LTLKPTFFPKVNKTQQNAIKVVMIDDELQSRKTLRILLQDYCPDVEILGEADGVLSGYKLLQKMTPDAIFLDIHMSDGTGFDLLNKFPNPSFQVIFITAHDDFAIKAFRYNAIDYLLKPINIDDMLAAIKKITPSKIEPGFEERLANLREINKTGRFDKIVLSSNEGLHFLELSNIVRLESEANYTTFHLLDGKRIIVSKTLKTFEELLEGEDFFRPHQSHIINLKCVAKIMREDGGYLLMKDDFKVPISRGKKEQFMNLVKDRFIQ